MVVEDGAELERLREGFPHVERGLAHVQAAQQVIAPRASLAGAPLRTVREELSLAVSQLKASLIMAGRLHAGALGDEPPPAVVELPVRQPSAVSEAHRVVAERRVIVNLGFPEGLAVLHAIEQVLKLGDLKPSARDRLQRVHELLEPRVARARRARRVAA